MGEVYLAEDLELKRLVALKVLPAALASEPDRIERFQREAESLASLNHPNIVTIFSVEQVEDRRILTMERVEGRTLAELLPKGGFALDQLFEIAIPLADALAAAHGKGITHRDLKPSNLMLTAEGRLKVLDFGLAKLQAAPDGDSDSRAETLGLTHDGLVVGTAAYMAPEQVEGEPVDHRADIFSLGVVLYELTTGRRPFTGASRPALMSAVLKDTPPPVEDLRPELPHHLGRIIRHCLEKQPTRRYQSALDVRNELESLRTELATARSRPSPARRNSAGRRLGLLGAVGTALMLAAILWLRTPRTEPSAGIDPPASPTIVVVPFDNLGSAEDDYFAAGMTDEITGRLGAAPDLSVVSRRSALEYAGTATSPREIGEELGVAYILFGSVRWASSGDGKGRVRITPELVRTVDGQQVWSHSYDRVIDDIFEVQADIAGQVIERLGAKLREGEQPSASVRPTENLEAYTLYLKGRHFWNKRTEESILRGLSYFEQAADLDASYALAWVGIADVWIFRGWYSVLAPRETFPRAAEAAQRALAANDLLAEAHASRAHIYFEFEHDWEAAEREYLRAIELDPKYPVAHHWYGGFLSAMGRHEEALEQAHLARRLDPLAPIISTWVGLRHYFARRYDTAIDEYEKALDLAPGFAPGHWHLGWAYEQTGRFEQAIAEALKAIGAAGGSSLYLASLGHAYAMQGDVEKARQTLTELDRLGMERHVSAYHTAVIHAALGDQDEAFRWMDAAFDERSPWIGYMFVDPRLDPLRDDPRFSRLLARARLPQENPPPAPPEARR